MLILCCTKEKSELLSATFMLKECTFRTKQRKCVAKFQTYFPLLRNWLMICDEARRTHTFINGQGLSIFNKYRTIIYCNVICVRCFTVYHIADNVYESFYIFTKQIQIISDIDHAALIGIQGYDQIHKRSHCLA